MRAHHARPAVVDHVCEVRRGQPVIDRHEDCTDLRNRVKRLQLRMGIRRDISHAVVLLHPQALERRRPAIAPVEEGAVCPPLFAIANRFSIAIQGPRAPRKIKRT